MAKGDILITASLDIPQSTNNIKNNDLPKLSAELQTDRKARVKIISGLDLKKSADLIQANLNTLVGKANAPSIKVGIDVENNQNTTRQFVTDLTKTHEQVQKTTLSLTNLEEKFKQPIKAVLRTDDLNKGLIDAEKTIAKVQEYYKELGQVSVKGIFSDSQGIDVLDAMRVKIKSATGEVRTLKLAINENDSFELVGGTSDTSGIQKLIESRYKIVSDLEQKFAQFKSTNSSLLSGLSKPISEFESNLDGLRKGNVSIDETTASFKALNAEASKITANLSRPLNPIDNAIRNIENGKDTIDGLTAEFKGLVDCPKEINEELATCASLLQKVKNIEAQEGTTANWSAAYKEWSDSVNSLTSKLKVLKKEQTNMFSAQEKISKAVEKETVSLSKQQLQWQKQGILVGDFDTKVQQLASSLASVDDAKGLEKYRSELQKINLEAVQLNNIKIQENKNSKLIQDIDILKNRIISFRNENKKAEKDFSNTFDGMLRDLDELKSKKFTDNSGIQQLQKINRQFRSTQTEIRAVGKTGNTVLGGLVEKAKKFSSWMSLTFVISSFVGEIRNAATELKEIDTILTEINKTSDRTAESLDKLRTGSFDKASKYGRKASDYLLGVQEMSRAGFGEVESESMAELSVLAQSAGDMTAELANEYLIATNAAYQLEGSAENLNKALDKHNSPLIQ